LSQANLRGADLSSADLRRATLTDADLAGARYVDATQWPAGFTPPPEAHRVIGK
jgi:uncharacterized protein YjbI with pentapeptide repeats